MKIAAKTEISPHEEALIQDFIKQMRQEHPNLELSMNDIYDSALRTGIDAVLEQIRIDRRQKINRSGKTCSEGSGIRILKKESQECLST